MRKEKVYRVTWRLYDHGNGCDMSFEVYSHRLLRCNACMMDIVDYYRARFPEDIQIMDWMQEQINEDFIEARWKI